MLKRSLVQLLLCNYTYIFGGSCPLTEFCQVQNSLCVQVLRSPILAALLHALHGTPAAGLSQTLRRGTRNGITELSQRVPPVFGWAAITMAIGPHSCYYCVWSFFSLRSRWKCQSLITRYDIGCTLPFRRRVIKVIWSGFLVTRSHEVLQGGRARSRWQKLITQVI